MSRERRPDPPAPVVTDEGVYGTLPRLALRDLERAEGGRSPSRSRALAVVFAVVAGFWLTAFSAAQATSAEVAIPSIARTLDAMIGLPAVLTIHEEAIRRSASAAPGPETPVPVPGLEFGTVRLTAGDVTGRTVAEWHETLRTRLAEAAYEQGMEPLRIPGGAPASDGGAFSTSGAARTFIETLSAGNHRLARSVLWPLGVLALVLAAGVLAFAREPRGFTALGIAVVVAAAPAAIFGVLCAGLVLVAGSDGSILAEETASSAAQIARLPIRNAATMALAGVALALPAILMALVVDRWDRVEPEYAE